jgi:hypothetical protein
MVRRLRIGYTGSRGRVGSPTIANYHLAVTEPHPAQEVRVYVVKQQKRRMLTLKYYDRDLRRDHPWIKIAPEVRASVLSEVRRQVRLLELDIAFIASIGNER